MTGKKLRELERRISKHLYNEAQLINDILEADLSKKEYGELKRSMERHPYHELANFLNNTRSAKTTSST